MARRIVVKFKGSRSAAKQIVQSVVNSLLGKDPQYKPLADSVLTAVGVAALSDIKNDFVRKSHGETGQDGVTWAPLKPATIAARRLGAADKKDAVIGARWKIVQKEYKKLYQKYRLGLPPELASIKARRVAEMRATYQTGMSKTEAYGSRQVDILRDTGVLLNSLTPGKVGASGTYSKPSKEGGDEQIFLIDNGAVSIGTTVHYAATHQFGDPDRRIPARPFLPRHVPAVWLDEWSLVGRDALAAAIKFALENAP